MSNELTIDLGLILLVAFVVAMISRRMRLPCSVDRVAAGIMIASLPIGIWHTNHARRHLHDPAATVPP